MVLSISVKKKIKPVWSFSYIESISHYSEVKWTCFFFQLLEIDEDERKYSVKGGKTFLGKLFAYQEKTGMSPKQIMKIPYILFVIGMLDAPSIDYDDKKKKKSKTESVKQEINTVVNALG